MNFIKKKILSPKSIKVLTLLGLPTTKRGMLICKKMVNHHMMHPFNNKVLDYKN
ncbi:MAG: hypothetical protein CM15mV51_1180 [uncultured marine virus]|nr:MAG: hypothetical protein CM15mV51_1180 [uncultured marine virus]